MQSECEYICDACGEAIVVPVDPSGGRFQDYVEDCPVCCHPNHLRVEWTADGEALLNAQPEQDRW